MSNRILRVQVRDHSLDPAQAEVWITVAPEHVTPATEVRGRLIGPRCAYAATVEVAYPLRPLLRQPRDVGGLTVRAVIPEPSLWEPECPFVYQGVVELWEDGLRCGQIELGHGLRRVLLGPTALRVNGRALFLRGRATEAWDEVRAAEWRAAGCNLLLAPAAEAESPLWHGADVQGFFVLGRLNNLEEAPLARVSAWAARPSCLGWLLDAEAYPWHTDAIRRLRDMAGPAAVGVELREAPAEPLPRGVDFIACPASRADGLRGLGLPLLLMGGGTEAPHILGVVA